MDSFLNNLGFDPGFLVIGLMVLMLGLLVMVIVLASKYNKINKSFKQFMTGHDGQSLESILIKIVEDNKKVKIQTKNNVDVLTEMKKDLKGCYKKIGLTKYDTFRGMAGKLSFAISLLDGENSGFVLNCMHTQDGCYSYLKEVIHGEVTVALSNEEKVALEEALHCDKIN